MTALTRHDKEILVLDLYYNQDKTYRQIAKEAKICPRDIKTIIDRKIKETEQSPYRLQSFMEYSMSVAYTSNSLCNINQNGNHERHTSFYGQCYLSPNYDSDYFQVENLKNIVLSESEELYNQKVDELKNQAVCESAVYENNKITDEMQSMKGVCKYVSIELQDYCKGLI
jgi:hypothetical protein